YHNEGAGRFKDVTVRSGIAAAKGKSLGVCVWDYDGDGWPDIFVANDTVAGFLFHNEGNGTFKEVGTEAGVAYDEEGNPHSGTGTFRTISRRGSRRWGMRSPRCCSATAVTAHSRRSASRVDGRSRSRWWAAAAPGVISTTTAGKTCSSPPTTARPASGTTRLP